MTYMASWKEKGVVPDSDDEESLDSHSTVGDTGQRDEPRSNDCQGQHGNTEKENGDQLVKVSVGGMPLDEKTPVDEDWTHEQFPANLSPNTAVFSKQDINGRRLSPSSSPASPQVFKVPRALWDLDHDLTDLENEITGKDLDLPANPLLVEDEISKSYVQLTSPLSSILSSLSGSQPQPTSDALSNNAREESQSPQLPHRISTIDNPMDESMLDLSQEPPTRYKRALRHRAPIQLKPYAIEQEKYRQTLKARGMKPMIIAQTQEDNSSRQHVPSSDPASQGLDSQEVEHETEESQHMDWDIEPVSPVKGKTSKRQTGDNSASDDDEFPDIGDLIRAQQSVSRHAEPKHRMKVYSSKAKRPRLFQIQTQKSKVPNLENKQASVYDVPASPPATSSPFPTTVQSARRTVSRAVSISSKEPTPSWLDQDELNSEPAQNLPTPATSAIKPVSDPIFLESGLDEDLSANELSDSETTSSDGSIQIREVGKKIRGVLPASHLRLDQQLKKQKAQIRTQRHSLSTSPQSSTVRRGVALPRAPVATLNSPTSTNNGFPFFSDDSESEESGQNELILGDTYGGDLDNLIPQSHMGYAEEDDKIDAMLPPQKRVKSFNSKLKKKRGVGSVSLPRNEARGFSHQPRITQQLVKGSSSNTHTKRRKISRKSHQGAPSHYTKPTPPRLSILDFTDIVGRSEGKVPQFIKVAARTARSKMGQGRQSPSKKFIRLANREDTFDAQSVLEEWKEGNIKPRNLERPATIPVAAPRAALGQIADNRQTRLPPPMMKVKSHSEAVRTGYGRLDMPRKLIISREGQMSMRNFISPKQAALPQPYAIPHSGPNAAHQIPEPRPARPCYAAPQSRPAQLESSEIEFSRQNPAVAFKKTKKALDALFRINGKRPAQQQNLQLHRFLADEDIARPSIETASLLGPEVPAPKRVSPETLTTLPKKRKRLPQRIDAGAAQYRQPSEPLVLNFAASAQVQDATSHENKLMGLGKFGVRYPIHFNIFPLQSGIFFHESTFIGSGRLSEAIKVPAVLTSGLSRGHSFFRLGNKDFRWGQWNEDVSSEVGLFFDFLVEQLIQCPPLTSSSDASPAGSMEFVIDFIQHHISFPTSEGRFDFLSRMLEVLRDFSSRVAKAGYPAEKTKAHCWVDMMARCTVLVMQLLQISRAEQSAITFNLEDLLKSVASLCTKHLIHQGLDRVRKLYDDLQYLSFRERGIKSDQYVTHAWVIILRVLDVARVPKGTFWDITNVHLADVVLSVVDDARVMEEIWYSVFSLLPLSEFDDFGVVSPNLRQRTSFDNWSIPQSMLRRVFALYSTNAKQPPGFNDYCRALVSRCHYLMCEWGWWKCSGMIGTLFDFFASQKLAHLRNEEVYKSPRFLEELDAEPSLDVEPEDRCFHVFLKIVSLAIKHMRKVKDHKGIRNLVPRLLPNHDRQYPKDETIHQRDLAALRNHHDLLCTLYWAAPPNNRPSLTLIQELVTAERSHKEACLINLRAWANLARYVFTSASEDISTSTTTEKTVYQQFIDWQYTFFDKLLHQYLDADSEVRRQAELLPISDKGSITEMQLQKTIISNRRSIVATMETILDELRYTIDNARDANTAMIALNSDLLVKILNPGVFGDMFGEKGAIDEGVIGSAIVALQVYMARVDNLHPAGFTQLTPLGSEVDSQGSLDLAHMDVERQMMIFPLYNVILSNFAAIIREILECRLYTPEEPSFMEDLVHCWARLVSLVTENQCGIGGFVVSGANAVFENRHRYTRAYKYWPLFLSQLLEEKGINGLKAAGFDLGLEWMQILTRKPTWLSHEPILSRRLYEKGHYLLKSNNELQYFEWKLTEWPRRHLHMMRVAFDSMRIIKTDPSYGGFADSNDLSERARQGLFSLSLKSMMDSMQQQLGSMIPPSRSHTVYVAFCQDAISFLRAFTNNMQPITDFFVQHSAHYWPKRDDPNLFAAGMISYSLRLRDQGGKAHFELFHFLYSGWKYDQMHSRVNDHVMRVFNGMKDWSVTEFMLANFVPATVMVGFKTAEGVVLPKTYLPALAKRIPHYLQRNGPEGASTFTHVINILKMMFNGICVRALNADIDDRGGVNGIHINHRGFISIACQFWISIQSALFDYVERHPANMPILEEVRSRFDDFICKADFYLTAVGFQRWDNWDGHELDVTAGDYMEKFGLALQDDITKHWMISEERDSVRIIVNGVWGGSTTLVLADGVPALAEVVKVGKCFTESGPSISCFRRPDGESIEERWPVPVKTFPGAFRALF